MFITLFILTSLIILLLPKDIITKKSEIDYEVIKEIEAKYVYYISDHKLVGVPIITEDVNKYELITLVFKYLTEKSNSVAKKYHTALNLNTKLVAYELRGDDIYLEVTDNFLQIEKEITLLALAQVLYSYKELGFSEVYITNNNKIIDQMADVVMLSGLDELPVNLDISSTSHNTKKVKITYYYKDNTKTFINHIINQNEDELAFTLNKLIKFINEEYKMSVSLIDYKKGTHYLTVNLSCKDEDIEIVKRIISKNLNIKPENIIIS